MKVTKKTVSFALAVILIFSCLSAFGMTGFAAEPEAKIVDFPSSDNIFETIEPKHFGCIYKIAAATQIYLRITCRFSTKSHLYTSLEDAQRTVNEIAVGDKKTEINLTLEEGTYYLRLENNDTFDTNARASVSIGNVHKNLTVQTAQALAIKTNGDTVLSGSVYSADTLTGLTCYYRLNITDKQYITLKELVGARAVNIYQKADKSDSVRYDLNSGYILLNRGAYYLDFEIAPFKPYKIVFGYRDFLDIKSIKANKTAITIAAGQRNVPVAVTVSPAKFNSKITWTSSNDALCGISGNGTTAKISGNYVSMGKCVITATTSEGLTARIAVSVVPDPMKLSEVSSVGKWNYTTVRWEQPDNRNVNWYRLYQLNGKEYKLIYQGNRNAFTVKNLKANSYYTFKISACRRYTGADKKVVVLESKPTVFVAVTAPNVAPVISSLKAGNNIYTPSYTKRYYSDSYLWGYKDFTFGNNSNCKVTVKLKSAVNGATHYYLTYLGLCAKPTSTFDYQTVGRASAKTLSITASAVRKNAKYNSIAYGPYSKAVNLRIPAAVTK